MRVTWISFYLTVFLATRLPFFVTHFVIELDGDYTSYAEEAEKLFSWVWPDFSIRPPLYPLLLAFGRLIGVDAFGILLAQSVFTALTGCAFLLATHRWRQEYAVLALVALIGAHCSEQWLMFDTTMSPDSVYANFLLLIVAALMLLASTRNLWFAIVASVLAGLAVWARPSGVVLLGVEILLAGFGLFGVRADQRWRSRLTGALLVPSIALMFILSTVNYFGAAKRFEFSVWGEMNLAASTMFLWKERTDYPDAINQDIARIRGFISAGDMEVIRHEWSPEALYPAFCSAFTTYFKAQRLFPNYIQGPNYFDRPTYMRERPVMRLVSLNSIAADPVLYSKYVFLNLYLYLTNNRIETFKSFLQIQSGGGFFGSPLQDRHAGLLSRSKTLDAGGSVWFFGEIGKAEVKSAAQSTYQEDSVLKRVGQGWFSVQKILFRNWLWPATFVLSTMPILILAIRRDTDFLVFGGALLMTCGSAMLTSLVEISITRYSFVTLPQFYFCGAFGIWFVFGWLADAVRLASTRERALAKTTKT
jgi:hypothetical protein